MRPSAWKGVPEQMSRPALSMVLCKATYGLEYTNIVDAKCAGSKSRVRVLILVFQ